MEKRALIPDIEEAKKTAGEFAEYKGKYSYKDVIFTEDFKDIVKLRVHSLNNFNTKDVIVRRKCNDFSKEFDTEQEALEYINQNFTHPRQFEFSRIGWHYTKDNSDIFIEDVENQPTIEIEGDVDAVIDKFNVTKILNESMPVFMKRVKIG